MSMQLRAKLQKSEGFTLIELLIVIVILGVLGLVGVPAYVNQVDLARENAKPGGDGSRQACAALRVQATRPLRRNIRS